MGKLDDVYLNDYFKSFGCIGEFTPIQLLKSSKREPSLKDKYRVIIDSLLCKTIGPAKGIIKGITTGDKSGISSKDSIQMSNAGIAHIPAVSGFHVSLISLIPFLFLNHREENYVLFQLWVLLEFGYS